MKWSFPSATCKINVASSLVRNWFSSAAISPSMSIVNEMSMLSSGNNNPYDCWSPFYVNSTYALNDLVQGLRPRTVIGPILNHVGPNGRYFGSGPT
jgi:hypothetical protein